MMENHDLDENIKLLSNVSKLNLKVAYIEKVE